MRQYSFALTMGAGAALCLAAGCGDNGDGFGAPDAGVPDGGGGDDAAAAACDRPWTGLQLGGERDDQIWGMEIDAANQLYVTGYEDGVVGVTNIEPDGNSRGVVMQIDPAGRLSWKAVLDTPATDAIEDIAIDPATGTGYAVGRTSGAFDGFTNQGQFDGFLVELDPAGKLGPIHQWGDERPQHPVRLSLGSNRDIAIAGYDDEYIVENTVAGREDGFVASFDRTPTPDPAYTLNFWKKVPNNRQNRITDVVIDRDGSESMYVTSFVSSPFASAGIFAQKWNSDGSLAWSTRISGVTADAVNAVAFSPSGDLFVAGATFLSLRGTNAGGQDAFIAKLNKATGVIEWTGQAGSTESDYPTALAFDEIGNVYIAGLTFGSVGDVPNAGPPNTLDIFAMKFDPGGTLRRTWQVGTAGDDLATAIAVDGCGRALVGGHTRGAIVKGSLGTAGGYDMFIVQAAL